MDEHLQGAVLARSERELAGVGKRPKPPSTLSAESTPPPQPMPTQDTHYTSLSIALAHRAPPRGYLARTPPPAFGSFRPDHTTTTPLTHQKHPRASLLLSRAEKEPFVLPAPEKKVDTATVFDQASPPFSLCLLPPSNPALTRCFSRTQEP
jgi:hypothetical protein